MSSFLVQNKNIGIRLLTENDLSNDVMNWFEDEDLMKYYTNSKNKITKQILSESIQKGIIEKNNFTYGIFLLENEKCIGTLRLGPINKHHGISDLVVLIGDKKYHGRGLAIEAIRLGNQIAFENHHLRKLFGGMYASNISSIKAYLRSGWVIEGFRRGQYWVNGHAEDRIEVACFNPKYFTQEYIENTTVATLEDILNNYPN